MSLGDLWQLEQPSQSRLNKKTIHPISGANIASVPLTSPATVFLCTATGSGFNVDEMYLTKADGSGRINIRRKHTHNADTDETGGSTYDIDVANASSRIAINRGTRAGDFHVTTEGAAITTARLDNTVSSNTLITRLRTATTSNNFTQLFDGGKQLSFSSKNEWHIKMQISSPVANSILWRAGVNMESVDVASSTTENRYGMEGCDGDGANIQIVCANGGAARSKTNSEISMITGMRGYAMYYSPGNSIVWKDSTGNIKTLGTNIPSSGTIASDRMLKYGIKTTNTTEKGMFIAADALFGKSGDPNWI